MPEKERNNTIWSSTSTFGFGKKQKMKSQ